ncbi:PAS-domain containing protein [Cognatiyoonia sp. IB215446]|uniref:PAS-domain containing protein n=1 Tax=Cognatiyoonia sp. IB215446 TaxID=3097355 RepID=UPI002A0BE95E|nr:PAS-domain containing protein [Cognatiyoonia sp. IB215446]MDX8350548.1 PAS-domain containing protein [Cognatiyoonia sp. IB215446]
MAIGLTDLALVIFAALAGAAILFQAFMSYRRQKQPEPWKGTQLGAGLTFLFRDKTLLDATPDAIDLLTSRGKHASEFEAMLHVLGPHFPDLRQSLEVGDAAKTIIAHGDGQPLRLCITREAGNVRLALQTTRDDSETGSGRIIENDVLMSELALLRNMTDQTPQLIWQEDQDGRLIWANQAYLSFADRLTDREEKGEKANWPKTSIFPDLHQCLGNAGSSRRRLSVSIEKSGAEHWFDIDSIPRDDGFLHFGTDANAAVRADQERRNFVQTLGKTFAHLNIGLAIFDKRRELAMFNPALLDLTGLSASFLSGRPSVDMVLDRLRETRILPEPKNYKSWREQFSAVEAGAKDGTYCEVWNLPDGQAYRVTGRPHPDGAFAFLIEDITAEVSLTRRFRSDIETGQAVLDTLQDAIAVFSSSGTLVISNAAYAELWERDLSFGFDQRDLHAEMQTWRNRTTPTRMWAELQAFTHMTSDRKLWTDSAILDDGRQITCHANPISGGMTMIRFTFDGAKPPIIQKLTMPDAAIRSTGR